MGLHERRQEYGVPSRGELSRRAVLRGIAGVGLVGALGSAGSLTGHTLTRQASDPGFDPDLGPSGVPPGVAVPPFLLGVASGDPLPDSVVLWTRLVRDPFDEASMGTAPVPVDWQVAEDAGFSRIVRSGTVVAEPAWAHSVHVDPGGLRPDREYYYRFRAQGAVSPVGRTRTTPGPRDRPREVRLAVASCQNWQHGYYPAHDHIAADTLDAVVFVGDYIYEADPNPDAIRRHNPPEAMGHYELRTLADFRGRYALYKSDPSLQRAHGMHPWVLTWDDHEVKNDYGGAMRAPQHRNEPADDPERFAWQRAAAYQAYYEHLPLRPRPRQGATSYRIHRSFRFGDLLSLFVLDTRQYRRHPPSADRMGPPQAGLGNRNGTLLGADQERWLLAGLVGSPTRWNAIAQQVLFAQGLIDGEVGLDGWDGYGVERERLLRTISDAGVANPVVLSGDMHQTWVNDLRVDFSRPDSPVVASEFVCPSISSTFSRPQAGRRDRLYVAENPHVHLVDSARRGYLRCVVDRRRWETRPVYVEDTASPVAAATPGQPWTVLAGERGIQA